MSTTIDLRNKEQKQHALQNVIDTCLSETIQPYSRPAFLLHSTIMGLPTKPSVYHSEALKLIMFLHRDPEN